MLRLRIEFARKRDDLIGREPVPAEIVDLPGVEILEVEEVSHGSAGALYILNRKCMTSPSLTT